uniref:Methylosome subunit pICln n=1 Tax=Drosophila melanogaster TaxID=7227 RepID=UPI0002ADD618|nr:Chain P, Methylosome subunit pICln [Drosophila melanogaster]4F7U_Q Chain Q, Methylosome subunit pICln [Drosophila melanogaster]
MVLIMHVSPPEHGLLYTANNIKLKLGDKVVGEGTVYIAQNTLSWQPTELAEGISIEWKQVSLHGISSNPRKCIYFMLDHKVEWNGVYGDVDEQFGEVTECWLMPEDIATVDTMYSAMTTCQALHHHHHH